MSKVCCFTGHRIQKLPWLTDKFNQITISLRSILKTTILQKIDEGYDYFISGMALGIDMLCADIVLELKTSHPEIKLECALPCEEQTRFWQEAQRQDYLDILNKADYITVLSKRYNQACLHQRNQYMVQKSDCLIAIWNGTNGGTKNTIMLASKYRVPVDIINPDDCVYNTIY